MHFIAQSMFNLHINCEQRYSRIVWRGQRTVYQYDWTHIFSVINKQKAIQITINLHLLGQTVILNWDCEIGEKEVGSPPFICWRKWEVATAAKGRTVSEARLHNPPEFRADPGTPQKFWWIWPRGSDSTLKFRSFFPHEIGLIFHEERINWPQTTAKRQKRLF